MSKYGLVLLSVFLLCLVSAQSVQQPYGVCPPFPLRDESGQVIQPAAGANATRPYSPRQTCGAAGCHDYAKITEGFHFQQGKNESRPAEFTERYAWTSSPGNYGGNWCSPAPLYRKLAAKRNQTAREIDMTSFEFITATCGNCHPGGGPLEFDREGHRYDAQMANPASGLKSGADNGFDGDYYKARWNETGVLEADCLLCHMPEYQFAKRNEQIAKLNFRWAATAGAGFGEVTGTVAAGEQPLVRYYPATFDGDGNVKLHLAPAPRNETCLQCHAKPDWKKRGASFSSKTDVHMAKGLKCVDCHTSGSRATDPRIRGKEVHQVGKGDDPSGWVRNDLDDTVRRCESCHGDGTLGAPIAKHPWLPPIHLERVACVACHIPRRYTKAALVQASDVYNAAPRITPPTKRIWTFYDQDMEFWNHYGELDLFTVNDQSVREFSPSLARYKGQIFPVDRVHSSWVGYEQENVSGLNMLSMRDFYAMWNVHRADPSQYPELARITDDSGDGMIEVNRRDEIDALLQAAASYLAATGFSMSGRTLVYVSDDQKFALGKEPVALPKLPHEATPYASVYKYSHNVLPARAALGAGGCTDCHSSDSNFFFGRTLKQPFDETGASVWMVNYEVLGLSRLQVQMGAIREERLKPLLYLLLCLSAIAGLAAVVRKALERWPIAAPVSPRFLSVLLFLGGLLVLGFTMAKPGLLEYMTITRAALDAGHVWISVVILLAATVLLFSGKSNRLRSAFVTILTITAISACGMILAAGWWFYNVFDACLLLLALALLVRFASAALRGGSLSDCASIIRVL